MRYLGVLEIASGWYFDAKHIPGILNDVADGISRWSRTSITTNLMALRPDVSWHEQVIGDAGNRFVSRFWIRVRPTIHCAIV